MARGAQNSHWVEYVVTTVMLILALLFPVGLMIFNPTLMFQRGWEQYVGTAIYLWAILTLGRELFGLWRNEKAFEDAPALLRRVSRANARDASQDVATHVIEIPEEEKRILPGRVRQLVSYIQESRAPSVSQLMEVNREGSGLDQEQVSGRFTLTRYILYLLPVIGFIGTVEGISRALMNISIVLPEVKNLDVFLKNLGRVTDALQIAFDSTLLALFLSAALMLVQTLVFRRSEELLAKVDRWIVEHVLPRLGNDDPMLDRLADAIGPRLDELGEKLARLLEPSVRSLQEQAEKLGESLRVPIAQFSTEIQRLPGAFGSFEQGRRSSGASGRTWKRSGRPATRSDTGLPASNGSNPPSTRWAGRVPSSTRSAAGWIAPARVSNPWPDPGRPLTSGRAVPPRNNWRGA